jgi:hypothetical protein
MSRCLRALALLAAGLLASAAAAQPEPIGQTWSAIGPRTLEPGANSVELNAGWPGLSVGYYRGILPGLNLGARLAFVYGVEGMIRYVEPGFKGQLLLKWRFLDLERVSLGLTFEPGLFFHAPYFGGTVAGFSLPLGLRLGIVASSALAVSVLVDLPMWVSFGPGSEFNVPVLSGVGVEYFVTSTLALFLHTRIGPTIHAASGFAELTFDASLGVAFKF